MRSLTITMYLLSICLLADAQQVYTYMLTDGWQATKAFDFGDDTCVIVGLVSDPNPSTNHRFHFTTINSENKVLKVDTFKLSSSDYVSYNSPFGLYSLDDRIIIAGLMSNGTAGLYNGAAFTFSKKVEKRKWCLWLMDLQVHYIPKYILQMTNYYILAVFRMGLLEILFKPILL